MSLATLLRAWRTATLWMIAFARPRAQEGRTSAPVVKATPDPVGELLSVPLQYNFSTAGGSVTLARTPRVVWRVGPVISLPGALVTQTVGMQPMHIGTSYFINAIRPGGTGISQARLVTSFPFPKKKKAGSN